MEGLHDAGQHVEHAGPRDVSVGNGERSSRERTDREDRVVVAEEQHLRLAAARPVHVRSGRAVDQRRRAAEMPFDHLGERLGRPLQRHEVERGRLDLDERAEVVEHRVG